MQHKIIKKPWVFDTSIFGCLKNATPLVYFQCFIDFIKIEDLLFIFHIVKKVSKRRESGINFLSMRKFTPSKSNKKRWVFDIDVAPISKTFKKHWFSYGFSMFFVIFFIIIIRIIHHRHHRQHRDRRRYHSSLSPRSVISYRYLRSVSHRGISYRYLSSISLSPAALQCCSGIGAELLNLKLITVIKPRGELSLCSGGGWGSTSEGTRHANTFKP